MNEEQPIGQLGALCLEESRKEKTTALLEWKTPKEAKASRAEE